MSKATGIVVQAFGNLLHVDRQLANHQGGIVEEFLMLFYEDFKPFI